MGTTVIWLAAEGRSDPEPPRRRLGAWPPDRSGQVRSGTRVRVWAPHGGDSTPGTVGSASRFWQRRAEGLVVWACGTVLSFFPELVCNFRPFGLNASRGVNLVRVCSGHSKLLALGYFELPHASHIAQIRSIVSRLFVLFCALLNPSRLCISCVHLCSRHSKLLAFRRVDLQHALNFGLEHFASSWPCSWQCTHNLVARASCCCCVSSPHELHMPTVLNGHSRAEWPVAPHVLHTRYGHVPLFWRCPDCAHSIQKFGQSFWLVRCESDPQFTRMACTMQL